MIFILILMFLKCVEALIMLVGIGAIVYYLLHPTKKNIHLSNGRPYVGFIVAFGWSAWTYSMAYADYTFFFKMGNVVQSTTVFELCLIEIWNIVITTLTCLHMLGCEFKFIKQDQ